jgi:lipopolysaccharide transport system permease protein
VGVARYLDPIEMVRRLWGHRALVWQLTRREVEGRYRGSFLGLFWSFIHPLVLLALYTFVAGVVFRARWPESPAGGLADFALVLFCGLVVFNLLSECATRAAGLIVGAPNFVKKVAFPLEVLPLSVLGSALFHGSLGLGALLVLCLWTRGTLPWTVVLLPVMALPLVLFSLGLSWLLASLGVFLRDLAMVVPLLLQVLFFATPIIYPVESVPERLRPLLSLNPLVWVVESFRSAIFRGMPPEANALLAWTLAAALAMMAGYAWFMKTKKGFADVM